MVVVVVVVNAEMGTEMGSTTSSPVPSTRTPGAAWWAAGVCTQMNLLSSTAALWPFWWTTEREKTGSEEKGLKMDEGLQMADGTG